MDGAKEDDSMVDESLSQEQESEEAGIYNQMHLEAEEVTSGYSTISSSKEEEYLSCHLANQNAAALAASKVVKANNNGQLTGLMSSHGDRKDGNTVSGKDSMAQPSTRTTNPRSRAALQGDSSAKKNAVDDFNDLSLTSILESERFKMIRVHKNQLTIKPSPDDHIEIFRQQEVERYKYPDRPWVYYNGDGSTSIVAPVIKKKTQQINQKPREHAQLKSQRPAIVTLLCLARDAAEVSASEEVWEPTLQPYCQW